MASAAGAALGTLARLEIGMISGFTSLLSLFTGLYGPASQSLASSVEQHAPLLAQANPLVADGPLLLRAPVLRLPGTLRPQLRGPAGHDMPVPDHRPDPCQEDDP